jgi:hypothetical protein
VKTFKNQLGGYVFEDVGLTRNSKLFKHLGEDKWLTIDAVVRPDFIAFALAFCFLP